MDHTVPGRRFVTLLVAVFAFCSGVGAPAGLHAQSGHPKQSSVSFAQYQSSMDQTYLIIDEMIASLDRSRFELDPLLEALDYDAQRIIDFVSSEIAFQQYPGVLRGARGTLMGRSGNSIDQSLLLASLLRNAGYDARIVEGRLAESEALELVKEIANPVRIGFSPEEVDAFLNAVHALKGAQQHEELVGQLTAGLKNSQSRRNFERIDQLSAQNFETITSALKVGESLELRPISDDLLDEAAQYFWVEYKEGASSAWKKVHPVFRELPKAFTSVTPVNYFTSEIPEEYQQRITISVEIEQSIGGEIRSHQVVPPWSRPTASLYGLELTFSNVPMNFTGTDSPLSQEASLKAAEFFIPLLNGAPASSMQVFDLNGNVAPSDAVIDPASGIFKQVGESFGKASAAMNAATSGDGSSIADYVPKLVAQTIEIELQAPGRASRIFTQSMIPENLNAFDDSGEPTMSLKDALASQLTIGLAMGDYPDQFVLSELVVRLKNSRPLIDAIHAQILETDEAELWDKNRFVGVPTNWGRMATLVSLMHQSDLPARTIAYFAEPGVIVHKYKRDRLRDVEGSLDIMSNTRRVFDMTEGVPRVNPEAQVNLGVWDTVIEEIFYQREDNLATRGQATGTPKRFRRLGSESDLLQIAPAEEEGTIHWMQRDLRAGFTLLIREEPSKRPLGSIAWWRIDERTGETLGMMTDGTGGAASVYPISVQIPEWLAKLIVSLVVSGAFAYAGYVDCVNATQEEQCCAETAMIGTIAGGVIGWGVGMTILWEFTVFQLFWVEVGINGAIGLYTGMDMFSELCTTTIFGNDVGPRGLWSPLAHQFAFRFPAECSESSSGMVR